MSSIRIIRDTCKSFEVDPQQIRGCVETPYLVMVRAMVAHQLRQYGLSVREQCHALDTDRGTIHHLHSRVYPRYASDPIGIIKREEAHAEHCKRLADEWRADLAAVQDETRYRIYRKPKAASDSKKRKCMMPDCGKTFTSTGPGHRYCNQCRNSPQYRDGECWLDRATL